MSVGHREVDDVDPVECRMAVLVVTGSGRSGDTGEDDRGEELESEVHR